MCVCGEHLIAGQDIHTHIIKVCVSIFHPRADAPFPLSHTFFFSHRQGTLIHQVNPSLVPKSELHAS